MAVSVYSKNLNIYNAEQFRDSVSQATGNSRLYLTFGGVVPYANNDTDAPPQANSSVTAFNEVWHNMIGGRLITGNDIRHVIRRIDWESGQVYDEYDHCTCSLLLFNDNVDFYVMTDDYRVYKCLSNNNGSISTTKPTAISATNLQETPDGYIWKFMYEISAAEARKYMNDDWIPVKTLKADDNSLQWQVQDAAVPGAINHVKVLNGGTGYKNANNITITIRGDGVGANAQARINATSQTITSIVMTEAGNNYTYATLTITDTGGGAGAQTKAIISPPGGHGSDPMRELGGSTLILNPRIKGTENSVLVANTTYRQISIIKDPTRWQSANVPSNTAFSQVESYATISPTGAFNEGEIVYQGTTLANATFTARVVEWVSPILKVTNTEGTQKNGEKVKNISGIEALIASNTKPDFEPLSGQLLYIDNIAPVERSPDQTEDYKIIIKF